MPASLTHLLTGREAAKLLEPESLPQFYLGCVLPDAPNLDGFASKETRWSAHLRDPDLTQWMRKVVRFVETQKAAGQERSLVLGYAVHIVGDIVWDEAFEKGLRKAVGADKSSKLDREECFRRRWDEHYRFEREQLEADWWKSEVRPLLEQAAPVEINGLSAPLSGRFRDWLLDGYEPRPAGKTAGYITAGIAGQFGAAVVKKLEGIGWNGGTARFPDSFR